MTIKTMNKTILAMALTAATILTGCKSVPSTESMYATSTVIGYSAGMVANQTKIDDTSRNEVIEIMKKVDDCIPMTNQTFESAWTPIAKEHTQKLVNDGKIDAKQAELILGAFNVACKGIDYLFDVRYPKARQYEDLVTAAVHGFTGGFLTTFTPANPAVLAASPSKEYDKDAYEYLTK